jgi:hypothetical protein
MGTTRTVVVSTLLVWEMIPENHTLFLIPNTEITGEQRSDLRLCAGHFGGTVITGENADEIQEAIDRINLLIQMEPDGAWLKYKVKSGASYLTGSISDVCITGFEM